MLREAGRVWGRDGPCHPPARCPGRCARLPNAESPPLCKGSVGIICLLGSRKPAEKPTHNRGLGSGSLKIPRTLGCLCAPFPPEASPHVRTSVHREGDSHSQQRAALAPLRVSGQNVPPPAGHPCEPAFLWPLSLARSCNKLRGCSTKSPASFGLKGTRQQLPKQFTCRLSAWRCLHSSWCVPVIIL